MSRGPPHRGTRSQTIAEIASNPGLSYTHSPLVGPAPSGVRLHLALNGRNFSFIDEKTDAVVEKTKHLEEWTQDLNFCS